MKIAQHANKLLNKSLGVEIKKTNPWRNSAKPEWPDSSPIGLVTHFGRKNIEGWVSANKSDYPIRVSLCINGTPVHSTWANVKSSLNTKGEARSFFIGTKGIWDFCKSNDRLTVRIGDKILPIQGKGTYKKPRDSGEKTLDDLQLLFTDGYVFNRGGTLQLSKKLDVKWQKKVIRLYNKTSKIIEKNHDITPFLIYGSLLGQVREGGFIGHDDDLDIAYISKHRNGPDAAKELVKIAKTLSKNGLRVDLKASAIHIHDDIDNDIRIDIFHLFFDQDEKLSFAFGVAGKSHFTLDDWEGTTKAMFANYPVKIPKNAEKMVECIYGKTWRTPIAGFNWNHARTRRENSSVVPQDVRDKFNKSSSIELPAKKSS